MRPMILVVDLASSDRTDWKSFLENQGYEVLRAGDEESALRQCDSLQPDLIMLHDTLPEIDAFGLCRRLKENPRNELIPIVVIKAVSEPADISRGRHAGAAEVWGTCTSLEEGLSRVQMLLRLNKYIDIYDALTTVRPYRMALSSEEALQILDYEVMNGWLHAALVRKFSAIRRASDDFRMSGRSMLASYYGVPRSADEAGAIRR